MRYLLSDVPCASPDRPSPAACWLRRDAIGAPWWGESSFCLLGLWERTSRKGTGSERPLKAFFKDRAPCRAPASWPRRSRHSSSGQAVSPCAGSSQDSGHRHALSLLRQLRPGHRAVAVKAKPRWFRGSWAAGARDTRAGPELAQEGSGHLGTGPPAGAARAAGHPAPRPGLTELSGRQPWGRPVPEAGGPFSVPLCRVCRHPPKICWGPGRSCLLFL